MLLSSLRASLATLLAFAVFTQLATAEDYGYPLRDRFVATVVGTPHQLQASLPEDIPLKTRSIEIFPDRELPDSLFYGKKLLYSVALQKKPAPLVFLIAGTGAGHNSGKNVGMARAYYQAGFNVVGVSSPTHINFLSAASRTGVPGHARYDAEDIYRVFEQIWGTLKEDIQVTDFYMVGYSLGGFNAAFVSKLDSERKVFDFKKVLLINPPVSLYSSISLLDRMVENIPGGEDNFGKFFNDLVRGFTDVYKRQKDAVGFGDEFLAAVFESMQPKDEELAALIGVSFRISSSSLVFVSDVMTDYGYIKPKGLPLSRYDDTSQYRAVSARLGFTDYYHEFFFPFYSKENPGMSRDEFINTMSLTYIADYLRQTENIVVMHNQDDIILEPGQIDFFREVFGSRVKIYPYGGHLGNMQYTENVAHMVGAFTQ